MTEEMDAWYEKERLHRAAQDGDLGRVDELLKGCADINAFDEIGKTPLHYAAEKEHFTVVKYLLANGADVNAHHEPTISNTALADVAAACSLKMAQLLVEAGADPTIKGWMGLDALYHAQQRECDEGQRVYELLLKTLKSHA